MLGDITLRRSKPISPMSSDATAAVAAYDPSFKLPAYNPIDAGRPMEAAGYHWWMASGAIRDGVTPLTLTTCRLTRSKREYQYSRQMQQDFATNLQVGVTIVNEQIASWKPDEPQFRLAIFDLMLDFRKTALLILTRRLLRGDFKEPQSISDEIQ